MPRPPYVCPNTAREMGAVARGAHSLKTTIRRRRTQRDGGQPEERWAGVRCVCDSLSGRAGWHWAISRVRLIPAGCCCWCGSVLPKPTDTVDVLYYVGGRAAYFRGTVLRAGNGAKPLLMIRFAHQRHYGETFPQETNSVRWVTGVVRVVVALSS